MASQPGWECTTSGSGWLQRGGAKPLTLSERGLWAPLHVCKQCLPICRFHWRHQCSQGWPWLPPSEPLGDGLYRSYCRRDPAGDWSSPDTFSQLHLFI